MSLPHITNSQAGVNKWDPVHSNIFEVYFSLPEPLREKYGKDEALITEHVLKISGLSALHKAPSVGQQKFMGTDRSYINPRNDNTYAEISVDLSLNLRNKVDNYIYNIFKDWAMLGYNIETGERSLKKDYCSDFLKISIGNRAGDIYQEIVFKDVMMNGGIDGFDELNYETSDALNITVKFVSDWWSNVTLS
jgi:hypothetical protein